MKKCIINFIKFTFLLSSCLLLHSCANKETTTTKKVGNIVLGDVTTYSLPTSRQHQYKLGWKLAVAEINDNDGINGSYLSVVSINANDSFISGFSALRTLTKEYKVDAVMGGYKDLVSDAASRYAAENKLPYLSIASNSDEGTIGKFHSDYGFKLMPGSYISGSALAKGVVATKLKRFVVVRDDSYSGEMLSKSFKWFMQHEITKSMGKKALSDYIFFEDIMVSRAHVIASDVASSVYKTPAEGVIVLLEDGDLEAVIKQLSATDFIYKKQFISPFLVNSNASYLSKKGFLNDWVVTGVPVSYLSSQENFQIFKDKFFNKYREIPTLDAALGYSAVYILAQSVANNKAGTAYNLSTKQFSTPLGSINFNRLDHQSNLPVFVGRSGTTPIKSDEFKVYMNNNYQKFDIDTLLSNSQSKKIIMHQLRIYLQERERINESIAGKAAKAREESRNRTMGGR